MLRSRFTEMVANNSRIQLSYEWELDNIEENRLYSSKMILFRGQKVFRVGLKNLNTKPTLFFVAFNLNKMAMQVADVQHYTQGVNTLKLMVNENGGKDGTLQLFISRLSTPVVGRCTIVFRINIEGSSESSYSYRQRDCLMKKQLWAAVVQNQNWSDVEVVANGKTFSAHKAVLAAQSSVFADEFMKEQPRKQVRWIVIDDVNASSVEQFLYFIYTGESITPMLDNKELFKLAERYRIVHLAIVCESALKKIDTVQMANFVSGLHSENVASFSFEIR